MLDPLPRDKIDLKVFGQLLDHGVNALLCSGTYTVALSRSRAHMCWRVLHWMIELAASLKQSHSVCSLARARTHIHVWQACTGEPGGDLAFRQLNISRTHTQSEKRERERERVPHTHSLTHTRGGAIRTWRAGERGGDGAFQRGGLRRVWPPQPAGPVRQAAAGIHSFDSESVLCSRPLQLPWNFPILDRPVW